MHTSQVLGDSDFPAVLRQLLPLLKPRGGRDSTAPGSRFEEDECGPDELILLLVYLYSLADEAQPADPDEVEKLERELIGALTLVITRETELSLLLQKLTGERSFICHGDVHLDVPIPQQQKHSISHLAAAH